MNLDALEKTGCHVSFQENYVGEPPNRHPVKDKNEVRSVFVKLTPAEWNHLCMRDGENYIGGCCGNASYIQDILNDIFRDSGLIEAKQLIELAGACENHPDGFEAFCEDMSQEKFDNNCMKWKTLHTFDKLATIWHGVKDRVKELPFEVQMGDKYTDPKYCVRILQSGLQSVRFEDIFANWTGNEDKEKPDGQKHGARSVLFARLMPAARNLVDALNKIASEPFEGYAIYDKKIEEVTSNGYGLCMYYTEQKAEEMIGIWKKGDKDGKNKIAGRLVVRKVRVTMENGIEYLN